MFTNNKTVQNWLTRSGMVGEYMIRCTGGCGQDFFVPLADHITIAIRDGEDVGVKVPEILVNVIRSETCLDCWEPDFGEEGAE